MEEVLTGMVVVERSQEEWHQDLAGDDSYADEDNQQELGPVFWRERVGRVLLWSHHRGH